MAPKSNRPTVNSEMKKIRRKNDLAVEKVNQIKIRSVTVKIKKLHATTKAYRQGEIKMVLKEKVRSFMVRVQRLKWAAPTGTQSSADDIKITEQLRFKQKNTTEVISSSSDNNQTLNGQLTAPSASKSQLKAVQNKSSKAQKTKDVIFPTENQASMNIIHSTHQLRSKTNYAIDLNALPKISSSNSTSPISKIGNNVPNGNKVKPHNKAKPDSVSRHVKASTQEVSTTRQLRSKTNNAVIVASPNNQQINISPVKETHQSTDGVRTTRHLLAKKNNAEMKTTIQQKDGPRENEIHQSTVKTSAQSKSLHKERIKISAPTNVKNVTEEVKTKRQTTIEMKNKSPVKRNQPSIVKTNTISKSPLQHNADKFAEFFTAKAKTTRQLRSKKNNTDNVKTSTTMRQRKSNPIKRIHQHAEQINKLLNSTNTIELKTSNKQKEYLLSDEKMSSANVAKHFQQLHDNETSDVNMNVQSMIHSIEKIPEKGVNQSPEKTITSPEHSKRNIASDSDLIEKILNEDDDYETNTITSPKKKFIFRSKVHDADIRTERRVPEVLTDNDIPSRSAGEPSNENVGVYEFLSLSQTVDSKVAKVVDPAADVIKRLIAEGKVTVATKRKGAGRPIIKRKVIRKRPLLKEKSKKNQQNLKNVEININNNMGPPSSLSSEIAYDDFDELEADVQSTSAQSGAFSNLARSVLIHEANKQIPTSTFKIQEQRRLLDAARKIVSTPIRQSCTDPAINLSPVPLSSPRSGQQMAGNASPWRVNDTLLPTAFNFTCNTANLPSFSSEYIASTPRKQFPKANVTRSTSIEHRTRKQTETLTTKAVTTLIADQMSPKENFEPSRLSFGDNDSNEENIAPENNFDNVLQQPYNPGSMLKKRSPLKALNILKIVNLPPWKEITDNTKSKPAENSKDSSNDSQLEYSTESSLNSRMENSTENSHPNAENDLFGFTEFIDSNENSNNDAEDMAASTSQKSPTSTSIDENFNLKRKLRSLKKWRPNIDQLSQSKNINSTNLFDMKKGKQPLIKEMLCSTMINQLQPKEYVSKCAMNDQNDRNNMPEEVTLFNEVEVESLENKKPTRTYARPVRKRKKRHDFIMFSISDESDSDEEDKEENNKQKRPRKEKDIIPELNTFINDFNSMCDEVEKYDLIIEKSA